MDLLNRKLFHKYKGLMVFDDFNIPSDSSVTALALSCNCSRSERPAAELAPPPPGLLSIPDILKSVSVSVI